MNNQKIIYKNFDANFESLILNNKLKNCLIVTTSGSVERGYLNSYKNIMTNSECKFEELIINDYPDISMLGSVFSRFQNKNIDLILSLGGGSVLDVGKLLSSCTMQENAEILFTNISLNNSKKIFNIAVPTTAGSGAESTQFATVWSKNTQEKFSFEDKKLIPEIVYLNAELTKTVPLDITLTTAMDALCHSVDSLLNINNTKESEDLSIESISLICKYLQLLINDLNNETTRFKLLEASNLAGRAINITKTSLNHAISYPLTNLYGIQHGFACCFSVIATFEKYEKNLIN